MKLLYLSTAIIPSKYANSVHIMKMCNAFVNNGIDVTILANKGATKENINTFYNIENDMNIIFVSNSKFSILYRLCVALKYYSKNDVIYTRNPILAFVSGAVFHSKTIYEYHAINAGRINKFIETRLVKKDNIRHIFITNTLKNDYEKIYPILKYKDVLVLPDGADIKIQSINHIEHEHLSCGYIGSFQKGKGVELIVEIANMLPNVIFHIVGGSQDEIERLKQVQKHNNIIWHGFVNQQRVQDILVEEIDIALLPNQKQVFIGKEASTDIGKYTSPMKLFEYMAVGKAIIASNLDVIKEVIDEDTAIFASSDNANEWVEAIRELEDDRMRFETLRHNAFELCKKEYTWNARARKVLNGLQY